MSEEGEEETNPYPAGLSSSDDEEDDDDEEDETTKAIAAAASKSKKRKHQSNSSTKKKKKKSSNDDTKNSNSSNNKNNHPIKASSMIDDAAVLSGSDDDDDDDDDEDDENDDYVKDDFVVDDEDVDDQRRKAGADDDGLLDSDDDDEDDEDDEDDDDDSTNRIKKRNKKRRVKRIQDRLSQEDLDLIDESRGIQRHHPRSSYDDSQLEDHPTKISELRNELFIDDTLTGISSSKKKDFKKQKHKNASTANTSADAFDEDALDDFIDDDVGANRGGTYRGDDELDDHGMIIGETEGVSEAQINEANDIFGTEFLDFMADNDADDDAHRGGQQHDRFDDDDYDDYDQSSKRKFRERGVGVDLGIDSDDDDLSEDDDDDDDDLFGDDDDGDGKTAEQRAEALRLKKEKRRLAKEERRKKKTEQRKAKLRRAFEPVQLIENFCTDRDDEIRLADAPERFFDWKTPFHGGQDAATSQALTVQEQQQATWIARRIPDIAAEYSLAEAAEINAMQTQDSESKTYAIVASIAKALRFLHNDKFEPEFIRRYRADEVTSPAVRDNLYRVMDEDTEWERILNARAKVESLLDTITQNAESDEALGQDEEFVAKLKEDLKNAQDRLDESVRDEEKKKAEIAALDQDGGGDDGDDDDDDLFGDDDDDNDNESDEKKQVSDMCRCGCECWWRSY